MKKIYLITAAAFFMTAFVSCGSSVTVKALGNKSAQVELNVELGQILSDTITTLAANSNTVVDSVFSEKEIKDCFNGSDFKNVSVKIPSKTNLILSGIIPAAEEQKAVTDSGNVKIANFIACSDTSLSLIISGDNVKDFVASLPNENQEYFDLLMAPVLTDEQMSPSEYIDLVASFYGEELAAELKNSKIQFTLECPSGRSIKKTSLSSSADSRTGRDKTTFLIPVAEFLCLSEPRVFSISW